MEKKATRLILVRHCQSAGNKSNAFQGQSDADISDVGAKQLDLLSLRFRNMHLDAIYSSPLMRAYKTAEAINRFHHLEVQVLPELMEIDVGELQGKLLKSMAEDYPLLSKNWNETPQDCVFPGGESMRQVYARAESALRILLHKNQGKTVLVASHGCLLRNMVCALLHGDIIKLPEVVLAGNTSISEFEITEDGVQIVRMNDLSHLPEELMGNPNQYVLK